MQKYARYSSSTGAVFLSRRRKRHGAIISYWLSVCAEQPDFDDPNLWEWSMDNLILKLEISKNENWFIRSPLLKLSCPARDH